MSRMFSECGSLKKLNLSNFNTDNVINMSRMFFGCSALRELDISNFNTHKIVNMNNMFSHCYSLNNSDLSNFKIENIDDINNMFKGCSNELINKIKSNNKNFINSNNIKYCIIIWIKLFSKILMIK